MDKKENKNVEEQISKNKFMNYIKSSTWISGTMSYNKDNDNKSFRIVLGEEIAKVNKLDLVLQRLDAIDTRLDNLEKDVSDLKDDMLILKR